MIHFLFGENIYARDRALAGIVGDEVPEVFDGEQLEPRDLPDIFTGATLFSERRCIVIKHASENSRVWEKIDEYLGKISDDTTLIFVETKPDKRTKTFKALKKQAQTREFSPLKTSAEATTFVRNEAKARQLQLGVSEARRIVERAGVDTLVLVRTLEKLELLEEITPAAIDELVDDSNEAQIYGLFQAALSRNSGRVHQQVERLSRHENAHQAFGFLSSQALQLAALTTADATNSVAKDIGAHPFALGKLEPFSRQLSRGELRDIVTVLGECDDQMKSSSVDPWVQIEAALLKIAHR